MSRSSTTCTGKRRMALERLACGSCGGWARWIHFDAEAHACQRELAAADAGSGTKLCRSLVPGDMPSLYGCIGNPGRSRKHGVPNVLQKKRTNTMYGLKAMPFPCPKASNGYLPVILPSYECQSGRLWPPYRHSGRLSDSTLFSWRQVIAKLLRRHTTGVADFLTHISYMP